MCSNDVLKLIMDDVAGDVKDMAGDMKSLADESKRTGLQVARLETKVNRNESDIHDTQIELTKVGRVATNAFMKAAGLYSLVMLIVGAGVAMALRS